MKTVPESNRELAEKMIQAYRAGEHYEGTVEEKRLYLKNPKATPFFLHYEDSYPEANKSQCRNKLKIKSDQKLRETKSTSK